MTQLLHSKAFLPHFTNCPLVQIAWKKKCWNAAQDIITQSLLKNFWSFPKEAWEGMWPQVWHHWQAFQRFQESKAHLLTVMVSMSAQDVWRYEIHHTERYKSAQIVCRWNGPYTQCKASILHQEDILGNLLKANFYKIRGCMIYGSGERWQMLGKLREEVSNSYKNGLRCIKNTFRWHSHSPLIRGHCLISRGMILLQLTRGRLFYKCQFHRPIKPLPKHTTEVWCCYLIFF